MSAFMLRDFEPPRSYLNAAASGPDGGLAGGDFPPYEGMPGTGAVDDSNGGMGSAGGGDGYGAANGGGGAVRSPGMLSVVIGLPFRLLGKVRDLCVRCGEFISAVEADVPGPVNQRSWLASYFRRARRARMYCE